MSGQANVDVFHESVVGKPLYYTIPSVRYYTGVRYDDMKQRATLSSGREERVSSCGYGRYRSTACGFDRDKLQFP
jgi:hypothetical protein